MRTGDTIIARATPAGHAMRAIVRLSGPETFAALRRAGCTPDLSGRGVRRATIRIGTDVTLPCLVLSFPAPSSYTGEDCAEVNFAGSPILVERVIAVLRAHADVRLAQPGEFSARAYFNGRMTLEQAEGVSAIIAARHDEELRAAGELLSGERGAVYRAWSEEIATLLALLESGIDFSDQEDVRPIDAGSLRARIGVLRAAMLHDAGSCTGRASERAEPRVVMVGAPNAGKSTLFNALLGRARAVASPVAGTTRDVIEEELDLGDTSSSAGRVLLCDAAGLMESACVGGSDASAQERARAWIDRADLVVWCDPTGAFDARGAPFAIDARSAVLVRTFADRPRALADVCGVIPVCALDGRGLEEVRREIASRAFAGEEGRLLPLRHRAALHECADRLSLASDALAGDRDAEFPRGAEVVASSLRGALDALGELVGAVSRDDIIGLVFARFCVGK